MKSTLVHLGVLIITATFSFWANASDSFPIQVDIRDITKQHLLNLNTDDNLYIDPPMHDHMKFKCSLLKLNKQKIFCELNNSFLYDNNNSYPANLDKLIDFRPYQMTEELFYNLYGANKFYNLEKDTNLTTSIILNSINSNFNEFNLTAVIYFEGQVYFLNFTVLHTNHDFKTIKTANLKSLDMPFQMHLDVGLLDAALLLNINIGEFKFIKVMPITVPGFNYELTQLKTLPMNKEYYLSNSNKLTGTHSESFKQRYEPDYYDGLPFLKILTKNNNYFAYGFHGTLFSRPLERGFLSTGCYRLKPKDIIELYYIYSQLKHSKATTITHKSLPDGFSHPMPMIKKVYSKAKHPKDGPKGADGLTIMERVYGKEVPIKSLLKQ